MFICGYAFNNNIYLNYFKSYRFVAKDAILLPMTTNKHGNHVRSIYDSFVTMLIVTFKGWWYKRNWNLDQFGWTPDKTTQIYILSGK